MRPSNEVYSHVSAGKGLSLPLRSRFRYCSRLMCRVSTRLRSTRSLCVDVSRAKTETKTQRSVLSVTFFLPLVSAIVYSAIVGTTKFSQSLPSHLVAGANRLDATRMPKIRRSEQASSPVPRRPPITSLSFPLGSLPRPLYLSPVPNSLSPNRAPHYRYRCDPTSVAGESLGQPMLVAWIPGLQYPALPIASIQCRSSP